MPRQRQFRVRRGRNHGFYQERRLDHEDNIHHHQSEHSKIRGRRHNGVKRIFRNAKLLGEKTKRSRRAPNVLISLLRSFRSGLRLRELVPLARLIVRRAPNHQDLQKELLAHFCREIRRLPLGKISQIVHMMRELARTGILLPEVMHEAIERLLHFAADLRASELAKAVQACAILGMQCRKLRNAIWNRVRGAWAKLSSVCRVRLAWAFGVLNDFRGKKLLRGLNPKELASNSMVSMLYQASLFYEVTLPDEVQRLIDQRMECRCREAAGESSFDLAVEKALRDLGLSFDKQQLLAGFRVDFVVTLTANDGTPVRIVLHVDGERYHCVNGCRENGLLGVDGFKDQVLSKVGFPSVHLFNREWNIPACRQRILMERLQGATG